MKFKFLLLIFGFVLSSNVYAAFNVNDPTQYIRYWQNHIVNIDEFPKVRIAKKIFTQLLNTWNYNKKPLPPKLSIVHSQEGAWAASLEDGNILLSLQALELILDDKINHARDHMAFILAHELAHQQSDDAWQFRFLRLAGTQTPETKKIMMNGVNIDSRFSEREIKADQDGLLLMVLAGFNPFSITNENNLFIRWTEAVWEADCTSSKRTSVKQACFIAKSRSTRTQAQLHEISQKSLFYTLGLKMYVAGKYEIAREYFSAFEQSYPNHIVHDAIGLTFVAEVTKRISNKTHTNLHGFQFMYPVLLNTQALPPAFKTPQKMRGIESEKFDESLFNKISQAIPFFERAIQLNPTYKEAYYHLSICYLLQNNFYMARGILQGKFLNRFEKNDKVNMLLAITSALEGKTQIAIDELVELSNKEQFNSALKYNIVFNLSRLYERENKFALANQTWKKLINIAKHRPDNVLLTLAIANFKKQNVTSNNLPVNAVMIDGYTARQKRKVKASDKITTIWLNGNPIYYTLANDGSRFVMDHQQNIISAWHENRDTKPLQKTQGLINTLGFPQRQINSNSGYFLAYDNYRLALNIENDEVKSWFIY